jgi:hypothetical protein
VHHVDEPVVKTTNGRVIVDGCFHEGASVKDFSPPSNSDFFRQNDVTAIAFE